MNDTLTAVPGVEVGHWTSPRRHTGVTVITFPEPNRAAAEVRGGAPGSRETALLAPGKGVAGIQGLAFSGGSAFGLAAADGVMRELAAAGRGHPTPGGPVPIVPAAIIFDLAENPLGDSASRPGPEEGAQAYRARTSAPVEQGRVGAGRGATTSQWRGPQAARPSGLGSACGEADGIRVGALAVVNPVGDVFTLEGEPLTGGALLPGPPCAPLAERAHTTLLAVATEARLSRADLMYLAVRASDAVAACIRPAHTRLDGDIVFAVSCGELPGEALSLGEAAFVAAGRAIARAAAPTAPADPPGRGAGI